MLAGPRRTKQAAGFSREACLSISPSELYELLISPFITPRILVPHRTLFKDSRLQLKSRKDLNRFGLRDE